MSRLTCAVLSLHIPSQPSRPMLPTCGFHTVVAQRMLVRIDDNKGPLTKTILQGPPQQLQNRNNYVELASTILPYTSYPVPTNPILPCPYRSYPILAAASRPTYALPSQLFYPILS